MRLNLKMSPTTDYIQRKYNTLSKNITRYLVTDTEKPATLVTGVSCYACDLSDHCLSSSGFSLRNLSRALRTSTAKFNPSFSHFGFKVS